MMVVTYAHDVVEEAVLLAERGAPPLDARAFRRARDVAYQIEDADTRETAFRRVHREWFARWGLNQSIDQELSRQPDLPGRLGHCRVLKAGRRQDEGADLFDPAMPASETDRVPLLVITLRPALLLDPPSVSRLLRHELAHVVDMLDPAFGYQRILPPSDGGPSADNITRDRYRVLWDVTIDGRLARAGFPNSESRAQRAREFAKTFPMLGNRAVELFEEWFDRVVPTHERLVQFARNPPAGDRSAYDGRCPLCRFPVASLDPTLERLSPETRRVIEREHPGWQVDQGLCAQCLDLYEARAGFSSLRVI